MNDEFRVSSVEFVIRHSSFVIRHSSLVIRHSSLVTRHSLFDAVQLDGARGDFVAVGRVVDDFEGRAGLNGLLDDGDGLGDGARRVIFGGQRPGGRRVEDVLRGLVGQLGNQIAVARGELLFQIEQDGIGRAVCGWQHLGKLMTPNHGGRTARYRCATVGWSNFRLVDAVVGSGNSTRGARPCRSSRRINA